MNCGERFEPDLVYELERCNESGLGVWSDAVHTSPRECGAGYIAEVFDVSVVLYHSFMVLKSTIGPTQVK